MHPPTHHGLCFLLPLRPHHAEGPRTVVKNKQTNKLVTPRINIGFLFSHPLLWAPEPPRTHERLRTNLCG